MLSELSEIMLIQVENIDLLKSRSQLFRNILSDYEVNSSINVDWHVNYFMNEYPTFTGNKWSKKARLIECNRYLVKDLGNNLKTVFDFQKSYALSFTIVAFDYYGCDELQEELVHLIAQTPIKYFMNHLFELSAESNSIRLFVEKVNLIKLE